MGRKMRSVRMLARELAATATSSVYLLLSAGVVLGILGTVRYAHDGFEMNAHGAWGWGLALLACALALLACIGAFWMLRRSVPVRPAKFVALLITASLASRYVLFHFVEPQWGTDYLRYWEYARDLVETGRYGGFNAPYFSRSLFIPYPIIRLFGPEATFVLKLVNSVLLVGVQLLAYDMLRRIRNHQAAQAASLLVLAAPIPAYMTLIPSHDLWGTFFLSVTAWLATMALCHRKRPAVSIPFALVAGIAAYATEVQRGLGLIFCIAMVLATGLTALRAWQGTTAVGQPTNRPLSGILVAILCLSAYMASARLDTHLGLQADPRPILVDMKFAANGSGMGTGTSDWFARFRDRFIDKQGSAEEARDFARTALLSAWTLHPVENSQRIAVQATRLYSLTYPRDWDWLLRNPKGLDPAATAALVFYADVFSLAFALLLVAACLRTAFTLSPPPLTTALCIVLIGISAVMLLVFENKPFNIFPIWLAGALVIGFGLSVHPKDATDGGAGRKIWHPGLSGLAAILLAPGLIVAILAATYTEASGRWFSGWSVAVSAGAAADEAWPLELIEARPEAFDAGAYDPATLGQNYIAQASGDGDRIRQRAGDAVTRMQFPAPAQRGDMLALSTPVCTNDSGRTRLEFFVYSKADERYDTGSFTLDVEVDGRDSEDIDIPLVGRSFRRFIVEKAFARNACHSIAFRLHALEPGTEDAEDPGPMVEIWMPRLIH